MGASSYNGKGSTYSYEESSINSNFYEESNIEHNSKINSMKKVLETLEELEIAKSKLEKAEAEYKAVEKKLARQIKNLDPEIKARFSNLLGGDNGPGGYDR